MWVGTMDTGTEECVYRRGMVRDARTKESAILHLTHLRILLLLLARRCYRPSDVDTAVRVFCFLFRRFQDLWE
jgi:hypothetical protein